MLKNKRNIATILALSVALSGCSDMETRVRNGLINAGLSRPIASCMAPRMVDRLNLLQLRRLSRLGDLDGMDARNTTLEQFLHRTRALQDPEILAVVTTSAAVCALSRR